MPTSPRPVPLQVREIDEATHREHLAARASASFLQTPGWGRVKSEWRRESVGFFDGDSLVGVALVLWSRARLGSTAPRPRGPGGAWKALGWWGP